MHFSGLVFIKGEKRRTKLIQNLLKDFAVYTLPYEGVQQS
jgi:hypothetical protein